MEDYIVRRWARPARVLEAREQEDTAVLVDGTWRKDVHFSLHPDDVERLRLGRLCMKCLEPFPEPFPDKCGVCGYHVAENQTADFQENYGGSTRNARAVLIEEELSKLDDKHERNFWEYKNGIIVPRGIT